jgi:hypothetical protein
VLEMNKTLFFLFRVLLFLSAFILVAYAMVFFGQYLSEFRDFYFRTGDYGKAIALIAITIGIGYTLKKLLMWEYRKQAGIRRKK